MLKSNKTALLITYPVEEVAREAISLADAAGYSIIEIVRLILDSQNTIPIVGNYKKCKGKFNP
jgi:hypothetical protein